VNRPEQILHKAVAANIRKRGVPGLVWFHVPNQGRTGGRKGAVQGAILKSLGLRAGVSDFILLHDAKFFALELKPEGERPTETQIQFLQDVNSAGGFAACGVGLDRALACLEEWGLVRGKSVGNNS
jgi:hypothetical protein